VMEITATERLRLRPLHASDLEAFVAYRSDPDVARYQSWDPTYTMTDAEALLAAQAAVAFGTPGAWVQVAALDRASGELVGDCAVHVLPDQPATAEVGVTLAPARQGSGLATEALGAIVSILFEVHHMHRIFGQADDRNTAVQNLFGRLGFRCELDRLGRGNVACRPVADRGPGRSTREQRPSAQPSARCARSDPSARAAVRTRSRRR
jgi:RimJ/RimL family protein N-acetyltransferase